MDLCQMSGLREGHDDAKDDQLGEESGDPAHKEDPLGLVSYHAAYPE